MNCVPFCSWRRRKDERLHSNGPVSIAGTGGGKSDLGPEDEESSSRVAKKLIDLEQTSGTTKVDYQHKLNQELKEGSSDRWIPDSFDYSSSMIDPDLPIIGDVSLGISLDLSALKPKPSLALDLSGKISSADLEILSGGESDATLSENLVFVRYFLNVLAYAGTEKASCSIARTEIVLYSKEPQGDIIPDFKIPKPFSVNKGLLNVDTPYIQSLTEFLQTEPTQNV